jgi:hypothetical protein
MREHEFTEREHQLPADPYQPAAPDMVIGSAAREDMESTPLGAPVAECSVRSVYDSRPVHGYDFNVPCAEVVSCTGELAACEFQVPQGYVAVVRQISTFVEPQPVLAHLSDISIDVRVNGSAIPYNVGLPVGVATDSPIETFFIADEYQTIQVVFSGAPTTVVANKFTAWLYGNLLIKTGRPAIFEIANCGGAVSAPPVVFDLPPTKPPAVPVQAAPVAVPMVIMPTPPPAPAALVCDSHPNDAGWWKARPAYSKKVDINGVCGCPPGYSEPQVNNRGVGYCVQNKTLSAAPGMKGMVPVIARRRVK